MTLTYNEIKNGDWEIVFTAELDFGLKNTIMAQNTKS